MKSFLVEYFRPGRAAALAVAMIVLCGATPQKEPTPDRMLNVSTEDVDGMTHFYAENLGVGNVTVTLDAHLANMKANKSLPCTVVVPGKQTVEVFSLSPVHEDSAWHYNYNFACNLGSAEAAHDERQVYELPYAPGSTFNVVQGYHGSFSHKGPDEYAIDWKMPEGTPVYAAREGLVVKSRDDSSEGGPNRKYQNAANGVFVQHSDGTIGVYLHLQKGGNNVKVGDYVKAGDLIGLSGNTGFTSGPHLHFAVYKLKSGTERVTIPVKFRTADSEAITLLNGHAYTATPMTNRPALIAEAPTPAK